MKSLKYSNNHTKTGYRSCAEAWVRRSKGSLESDETTQDCLTLQCEGRQCG